MSFRVGLTRELRDARTEADRCRVAADAAARHLAQSEREAAAVAAALAPKEAEVAKLEKEVKKLSGKVRSLLAVVLVVRVLALPC